MTIIGGKNAVQQGDYVAVMLAWFSRSDAVESHRKCDSRCRTCLNENQERDVQVMSKMDSSLQ